jgi:molybdopterin synthase sulfur carrier subunit
MLNIKYFASLRERLGIGDEQLLCPSEVSTIKDLRVFLAARGGEWARLTTMKNLRCALNQAMADDTATVRDGDEVAFFPPVTGG